MIKIFKDKYDKNEFYMLMGKYFAERKYKKLMPYLVNEENSVWYVAVNDNEVIGFINYVNKLGRANIGYCYIEEGVNDANLLEHNLIAIVNNECCIKNIYVEVEKSFDKSCYLDIGFEIYKETTNYWYLAKKVNYEEVFK